MGLKRSDSSGGFVNHALKQQWLVIRINLERNELLDLQLITNSLISEVCLWYYSLGIAAVMWCDFFTFSCMQYIWGSAVTAKKNQCWDFSGFTCFLHPWIEKLSTYGKVSVLRSWQTYMCRPSRVWKCNFFNAACLYVHLGSTWTVGQILIYIRYLKVYASRVIAHPVNVNILTPRIWTLQMGPKNRRAIS